MLLATDASNALAEQTLTPQAVSLIRNTPVHPHVRYPYSLNDPIGIQAMVTSFPLAKR